MSTPSAKQSAYAERLFQALKASNARRTGHVMPFADHRADMLAMDWNPDSAADVSNYIGIYQQAARDARIIIRGGR